MRVCLKGGETGKEHTRAHTHTHKTAVFPCRPNSKLFTNTNNGILTMAQDERGTISIFENEEREAQNLNYLSKFILLVDAKLNSNQTGLAHCRAPIRSSVH